MFEFKKVLLEHKDGTKDYTIYYAGNQDTGKCVVIRKWGKIGTSGQTKTTGHDRLRVGKAEFDKQIKVKERRGYSHGPYTPRKDLDEKEVRELIGGLMARADFTMTKALFAKPIAGDEGISYEPGLAYEAPKAPPPKPEPEIVTDSRWGTW